MKPSLGVALTIFSICMSSLAYWQLSKAWTKYQLEQEQATLQTETEILNLSKALQLWQNEAFSIQGLDFKTNGTLVLDQFLLHDNRVYKHQAGYGLYALYKLTDEDFLNINSQYSHLLLNLGWIQLPNHNRSKTPQIQLTEQATSQLHQYLEGKIEVIHTNLFQLGQQPLESLEHPEYHISRMQYIDFEQLNKAFNAQLLPFVLHVTADLTTNKLPPLDIQINQRGISAAKHLGYGLQWLCFLFIGWGVFFYTRSQK